MKNQQRTEEHRALGRWKHIAVITLLVSLLVGVLTIVNGCAVVPGRRGRAVIIKPAPATVVYVQKAPPPLKVETRPPRPSSKAVWIPGHWQWRSNKYVWLSGHWETNPRGTVWVPGKWEQRHHGWFWVQGHWR